MLARVPIQSLNLKTGNQVIKKDIIKKKLSCNKNPNLYFISKIIII
jgi:hypothetical protein